MTEHLEIHIIEIPKIYKKADNEKDAKLIRKFALKTSIINNIMQVKKAIFSKRNSLFYLQILKLL